MRANTLQHQADAVQGRQQEEDEREQETAVIGLAHTAVYPTTGTDRRARTYTQVHTQADKTLY